MRRKIGFLVKSPKRDTANPVILEICKSLQKKGVETELIVPEEQLICLPIEIDCDLYVLRPGVEMSLSLAGILHDQGARIVNSFNASNFIHDKFRVTAKLIECGLPTPNTCSTKHPDQLLEQEEEEEPEGEVDTETSKWIIKPHRGSGGEGIEVIKREHMAQKKVDDGPRLIQKFLNSDGNDLKVYVIGKDVFAIKRPATAKTFEDKVGVPYALDSKMIKMALKVGEIFGLEIYGIDFLMTSSGPFIIDVNYFPGMIGVPNGPELLAAYLYSALEGADLVSSRKPLKKAS